jgi:2-keto-3-deoxy-6-phosphogluconate aldolase
LDKHPEALLLAGTVLTREQARDVLAAGVAGVVSADYVPAVVEECVANDVMCVPGGLADAGKQLVQKAELYGLTLEQLHETKPWQWVYKVFPAMVNPKATLATGKAWRAVYPGLQLVYTGGVTLDNVGSLARQDLDGIFCGSAVTRHAGDPDRIREEAELWLETIRTARASARPPVRLSARPARPPVRLSARPPAQSARRYFRRDNVEAVPSSRTPVPAGDFL